jgi:hypothetical protein
MDKITCIAFIMYHSSEDTFIKDFAVQILNGDITLREAKKDRLCHQHIALAVSRLKKEKLDSMLVQAFAEEFLLIEA